MTLPEAVLFGTMIGLGLTGFLLAKETRPWYVYILLALVNCIISILVYAGTDTLAAWLGGGNNDGYRSAVSAGSYGVRGLRIYQQGVMVVKELQDEIVTVVFSELLRAQKEHGETFNSMPEAFSVIWEEIEEANEEMQRVQQKANDLWLANRRDDADAFRMCASKTAAAATLLACEAVQVAAMCIKAQKGSAAWSKGKNG